MGLVNHAGLVKARSNYFGVQSHIGHSRSTRARPCGCSRAELGEVDPLFTSKQISNTRKRKLFATLHPISNITCVHHGVNSNLIIHQGKQIHQSYLRYRRDISARIKQNLTMRHIAATLGHEGWNTERFFESSFYCQHRKLNYFSIQNIQHIERAHISSEAPRFL